MLTQSLIADVLTDWSFYVVMIPAVIILGLAKGGFAGLGLLGVPMMAMVMSPLQATAILMPILCAQDVISVWVYRRQFDKRNLMVLLPGAVIGVALGYFLAKLVPEDAVRLMVGLVAVIFVGLYWKRKKGEALTQSQGGTAAGVFWGAASAYTSFVAHAGAPPFQVYVMPQRLPPQVFAGTTTMFFAATNAMKAVSYFWLGQFSADNLTTSALLLPIAILSTFWGVWLVRRFDSARFYTLIYGLTFVLGWKLVWDGVKGLV